MVNLLLLGGCSFIVGVLSILLKQMQRPQAELWIG
jgi:hypothetical protein